MLLLAGGKFNELYIASPTFSPTFGAFGANFWGELHYLLGGLELKPLVTPSPRLFAKQPVNRIEKSARSDTGNPST